MNKECMLQLADYLDALPEEKFDMDNWCGTACCIAGHAQKLFKARHRPSDPQTFPSDGWLGGASLFSGVAWPAMRALGLSEAEAETLFLGDWFDGIDKITKAEAVAHLRSLVAGEQ